MIFFFLKTAIWLAGVVTLGYFALGFFDYGVNWDYYEERKTVCQERLEACRKDLVISGIEGAKEKCDFQCVDPSLLIKKVETE